MQVYELHRLYHIQKLLMKSAMGKSRPNKGQKQDSWINPQRKVDLEQPAAAAAADEYIADTDGDDHGVLEMIDESEIELTLGPTRYNNNNNSSSSNRRKRREAAVTCDSGPSFSSSSTGSSHVNKTSSSSRTHQRKNGQVLPDMASGYRSSSNNNNNIGGVVVEEQLRQDERLKLPPWLFQVMSLNMT